MASRRSWNPVRWLKRHSAPLVVAVAVLVAAAFVALLWRGAPWLDAGRLRGLTPVQRESAINAIRGRLLQLGAGLVIAAGLIYTGLTFRLNREGHVTDRYTKAIDQLGSEHLDVRLGAIYALERIMIDSERDHPTIVEVLAAYIREHAALVANAGAKIATGDGRTPTPAEYSAEVWAPPATDIQAALTVLGRRPRKRAERGRLSLQATRLVKADLSGAQLTRAVLVRADLGKANLIGAKLRAAWLGGADMRDALLNHADLSFALLDSASLTGAHLPGADLTGADLTRANLVNADLSGANLAGVNLTGAALVGAKLRRANLRNTQLSRANFSGADLIGANLTDALLNGAKLAGAILNGAILNGAKLTSAKLTSAKLNGVDLIGADLTGAILVSADLTGADLTRAHLTEADLTGADLTDARLPLGFAPDAGEPRSPAPPDT